MKICLKHRLKNAFANNLLYFIALVLIPVHQTFAQNKLTDDVVFSKQLIVNGKIENYDNKPIYIFQCYGDTLLFIDSIKTDQQGRFSVLKTDSKSPFHIVEGIYRFNLLRDQWFYLINTGDDIEITTVYLPDIFNNHASDSLKVLKSNENKKFYKFQETQKNINVANYMMKEMMRLFPIQDPFHQVIEKEYQHRFSLMHEFMKEFTEAERFSGLIANAYYKSINPDWKEPDSWRDSVLAAHYFDHFDPSNKFYLQTNILPDKMEEYLNLETNKKDAYGQPVRNEIMLSKAAQKFLSQTSHNKMSYEFCLNYFLKLFSKEQKELAFISLYDATFKTKTEDCGHQENGRFSWAKEKADIIRGVQIGSIAHDFEISDNLFLNNLDSEYVVLLFWASWCQHCAQSIPEINKTIAEFNLKSNNGSIKILTVAISLDSDYNEWQNFVKKNNLNSFLNYSELKGWNCSIAQMYNVSATPSMFLLNRDKRIIALPNDIKELTTKLNELDFSLNTSN